MDGASEKDGTKDGSFVKLGSSEVDGEIDGNVVIDGTADKLGSLEILGTLEGRFEDREGTIEWDGASEGDGVG